MVIAGFNVKATITKVIFFGACPSRLLVNVLRGFLHGLLPEQGVLSWMVIGGTTFCVMVISIKKPSDSDRTASQSIVCYEKKLSWESLETNALLAS